MQKTHSHTTTKLITFHYTGQTKQGQRVQGELQATSLLMAKGLLRRQGISVITLRPQRRAWSWSLQRKTLRTTEINLIIRQLATLLKSGIPLLQSLTLIAQGSQHAPHFQLIQQIKQAIENGHSLAMSLRKYPHYFDDLTCSLIEMGEQSGTLEPTLAKIANYREKQAVLTRKIQKALLYPSIVFVVAIGICCLLMIFVIPTFQSLFQSMQTPLPIATQWVISFASWIQQYIVFVGVFLGAIYGVFRHYKKRSPAFQLWLDTMLLKLPIIGRLHYQTIIARYARTLATTFQAGIPLIDALSASSKTVQSLVYQRIILSLRSSLINGQQLYFAMQQSQKFPTIAVQLIEIGEQSGHLDTMLDKVALHFEQEVEQSIDQLTTLIEPLMIIILGFMIGGLVIAMYLPILNMGALI